MSERTKGKHTSNDVCKCCGKPESLEPPLRYLNLDYSPYCHPCRQSLPKAAPMMYEALSLYIKLDNDRRSGCEITDDDWAECHQVGMAALDAAGGE